MLQRLTYFSTRRIEQFDLETLVQRAAHNNRQIGVTGLLIAAGAHFVQTLEGPREAVSALFLKIAQDARHSNITLAEVHDVAAISFPEWGMERFENVPRARALWSTLCTGDLDPAALSARQLGDFLRAVSFEMLKARST